eukprot:4845057-Prymnesium_polylepis.1
MSSPVSTLPYRSRACIILPVVGRRVDDERRGVRWRLIRVEREGAPLDPHARPVDREELLARPHRHRAHAPPPLGRLLDLDRHDHVGLDRATRALLLAARARGARLLVRELSRQQEELAAATARALAAATAPEQLGGVNVLEGRPAALGEGCEPLFLARHHLGRLGRLGRLLLTATARERLRRLLVHLRREVAAAVSGEHKETDGPPAGDQRRRRLLQGAAARVDRPGCDSHGERRAGDLAHLGGEPHLDLVLAADAHVVDDIVRAVLVVLDLHVPFARAHDVRVERVEAARARVPQPIALVDGEARRHARRRLGEAVALRHAVRRRRQVGVDREREGRALDVQPVERHVQRVRAGEQQVEASRVAAVLVVGHRHALALRPAQPALEGGAARLRRLIEPVARVYRERRVRVREC